MQSPKVEKIISLFLVLLFLLTLIPILWLGNYNYLSADDYGFSANAHLAFQETHSIFQAIHGAIETVIDRWYTWQGTFSTVFLMALQPAVWNESLYCLVPWIMIGAMVFSTMFLLYVLLIKVIRVRYTLWISLSMLYLLYTLQCMIDKTQAFYWYNGAAHYIIPHAVALTLIAIWIITFKSNKYLSYKMILCCLLSVFLGGSNYITALIIAVLYTVTLFLLFFKNYKREWKLMLFPFALFIIAFLLNTLAPGNAVRQAMNTNRPGVIKSILLSFYYCVEYLTESWFDWTCFIFILALLPFLWEIVKIVGNRFSYRYPLLIAGFSYCLLSAMFTPSLYASGIAGGGRIFNIIFLDAVLLLIGNLFYFIGWFYTHKLKNEVSRNSVLEYKDIQFYLCGILCLTLFISLLYAQVKPNYFTTTSAVSSLLSGEASSYNEEGEKRTLLLQEALGKESVTLPLFTTRPYLLFFEDIDQNPNDWKNSSMARYYGFNEVIGTIYPE